jgi:hypothetical protein
MKNKIPSKRRCFVSLKKDLLHEQTLKALHLKHFRKDLCQGLFINQRNTTKIRCFSSIWKKILSKKFTSPSKQSTFVQLSSIKENKIKQNTLGFKGNLKVSAWAGIKTTCFCA